MPVPEEIRNLTEAVLLSFESGIDAVGHLIEQGLELLDGYRREQEALRGKLREGLATVGGLRKKDFDGVMEGILDFQSDRESEIKALIKGFLSREKELTERIKRSLQSGLFQEIDPIKGELAKLIEQMRGEVVLFQKEQGMIHQTLMQLEEASGSMTARELKRVI